MTREELMEYAKANYPIGTKYICVGNGDKNCTIKGELKYHDFIHAKIIGDGWGGFVYYAGAWAEKYELIEDSLEQARQIIYKD